MTLALLLAYWTLAFVGTHLPGTTVQSLKQGWMLSLPHADKIAHTVLYAGLAFLLMGALRWVARLRPASSIAVAFSLASIYGIIDEYLQSFIPRRSMDVADWLADNMGAGIGVVTFMLLAQAWSSWRSSDTFHAANS
jgi:hypothetical protein